MFLTIPIIKHREMRIQTSVLITKNRKYLMVISSGDIIFRFDLEEVVNTNEELFKELKSKETSKNKYRVWNDCCFAITENEMITLGMDPKLERSSNLQILTLRVISINTHTSRTDII